MENLDGATIFWLVTLGLILGAAAKVVLGSKGLQIGTNLAAGVIGTVSIGAFGIILQIPGSLLLSVLGGISILFLANVFFLQEDHGESDES